MMLRSPPSGEHRLSNPPDGRNPNRVTLRGIPVAPGLAVGSPVFHDSRDVDVPVFRLRPDQVKREQRRLAAAIRRARIQLEEVEHKIEAEVGRRDARIFSVQNLLLDDPTFRKAIRERIADNLVNAEVAVRDAVSAWTDRLTGVSFGGDRDPADDLRDVGRQLIRNLLGGQRTASSAVGPRKDGQRVVLVTQELLPSDTAHLDREHLAAIVTSSGGVASHAAILARALGIPAITGVDVSNLPARGGPWIVDGSKGLLILDPSTADVDDARARAERFRDIRQQLMLHTRGFARTADDVAIEILLNVENFAELPEDIVQDLRGVGLYRTEFLFMDRKTFPSEEEQYQAYKSALEKVGEREITFRTIDVGGDKPLRYLTVPTEPNPVLGWRGLRLSLQWPDIFYAQFRALLRASAHGRMRILLPMVTMVEELRRAREILHEIMHDLKQRDIAFDEQVPLGVMVEVPAAAVAARNLAREADFLSVGTNDLSQYALAVDRNNARVAHLYQPMHPGLLQLVQMVIDAGAKHDTPVCVCGEMAGEPESALLLLGMGLRSFSMSPYHVPAVRKLLASVTLHEAQEAYREVMELGSTGEIRKAVRAKVLALAPELEAFLVPLPRELR